VREQQEKMDTLALIANDADCTKIFAKDFEHHMGCDIPQKSEKVMSQ